ncbi:hypothetical protein CYMTET_36546 [Cymbomonas tetramitiformis]|uniref:Uncharacterized protein n=1 Tax=Cymbomonas tetramitiformis TaxID=36881 RepID=A0AAE0CFP9_9CHLO|nr:hypothetical protein CYMTET_43697 [Cymbomonas tetramitiformis]KAK3254236.1 hypothetical protein CYMTET_36546 [Cymbomonas tetramitiformis]
MKKAKELPVGSRGAYASISVHGPKFKKLEQLSPAELAETMKLEVVAQDKSMDIALLPSKRRPESKQLLKSQYPAPELVDKMLTELVKKFADREKVDEDCITLIASLLFVPVS